MLFSDVSFTDFFFNCYGKPSAAFVMTLDLLGLRLTSRQVIRENGYLRLFNFFIYLFFYYVHRLANLASAAPFVSIFISPNLGKSEKYSTGTFL
jgi:hypothetical protein